MTVAADDKTAKLTANDDDERKRRRRPGRLQSRTYVHLHL